MNSFDQSLAIGKQSEELVLNFIRKKYPCYKLEGYCKQSDLVFYREGKWEGVECKQDFMSDTTGNWVIETSYGGRDSGIITTGSSYWVLVDHTHMHFIRPHEILKCIAKYNPKLVTFTGPNDPVSKTTYLIPKETIGKYVSFLVPY